MQIVQKILEVDASTAMVGKRLLVSHGDGQFCAIYQQLYDAAQVIVKPASLFTFDGERVLKTLDQNGNATWNEEYWAFDASGPIHLDLANVRRQLQQAAPKGDVVITYPFDWKAVCHKTPVWKPKGDCPTCGSSDGFVLAKLALNHGSLSTRWARWFPSGVDAACPVD